MDFFTESEPGFIINQNLDSANQTSSYYLQYNGHFPGEPELVNGMSFFVHLLSKIKKISGEVAEYFLRTCPSYQLTTIIIIWLVQWTLPFPQAPYMPVSFVLNRRQLPNHR